MQKVLLALCATLLLLLGAVVLFDPGRQQSLTPLYLGAAMVMALLALIGLGRQRGRRLPSAGQGLRSGLGLLQLILAVVGFLCIVAALILPTRFEPGGMGPTWVGMGLVGYSWLISQVRLERDGVPTDSERQN